MNWIDIIIQAIAWFSVAMLLLPFLYLAYLGFLILLAHLADLPVLGRGAAWLFDHLPGTRKKRPRVSLDLDSRLPDEPTTAEAYLALGQEWDFEAYCASREEKDAEDLVKLALVCFAKAIRLKPEWAETYCRRAQTYTWRQDDSAALADYDKAIELDPECAHAFERRGNIHRWKNDFDLARADYDRAIRLDSKNASFYQSRAELFKEKEDYDQAVADYSMAISLAPEEGMYLYDRGFAYFCQGKYAEAIGDLNSFLEKNPGKDFASQLRDEACRKLEGKRSIS